jgi:hypothetical protein
LVDIVKEVPVSRGYRKLEKGLTVTTNSHQPGCSESGLASGVRRVTLLGRGRAAVIALNVLLPFTFA